MTDQAPILFYDGECGMCQKVVRFSIARDRSGSIKFAPINGVTWKSMMSDQGDVALTTVYFLDSRGLCMRSTAICRLLGTFGGIWKCLGGLLWIIPRPLRNLGYRLVARNRYRLSGRVEACTIPSPENRERLLP